MQAVRGRLGNLAGPNSRLAVAPQLGTTGLFNGLLAGSLPSAFQTLGSRAVFLVNNVPEIGGELWSTDGTPDGTQLLGDIRPGSRSSNPDWMTVAGSRRLYFNANDGQSGTELWRTDGTPAGTELFLDLRPGPPSSLPERFTLSSGRLLFTANDGLSGQELWTIDPGATAQRVGVSCGSSGADLTANDPVLGAVMTVSGNRAPSGAIGFVLLGLPRAPVAIITAPCFLYLHPPSFAVLSSFVTGGATWSLSVPIPGAPSLTGVGFALQAVLAPTATPTGVAITNGVFATMGH